MLVVLGNQGRVYIHTWRSVESRGQPQGRGGEGGRVWSSRRT